MGLLLRFAHLHEMEWLDFRKMMHAHSHVAMLGWAFLACYFLIWHKFLPESFKSNSIHNRLFWFFQLSVLGMAISFPIQGYAFYSISFSTLHVVLSYYWVYKIWNKLSNQSPQAVLLVKTALVFMLLSTLGLYVLGASMSGAGKSSALYHGAIQFFLHFQFNGWFTFAVLAFLLTHIQPLHTKQFNWFYALLLVSCLLTYALSVTWSQPEDALFVANGVGVIMQMGALVVFLSILRNHSLAFFKDAPFGIQLLLLLALFSFGMKILVQMAVVIPQVAVISYTIRQFVVGFIHLTMLGSVSAFLLAEIFLNIGQKSLSVMLKVGIFSIVIAFISSEILLFLQGQMLWMSKGFIPYYYELIFAASILFPVGLIALIIGFYKIRI